MSKSENLITNQNHPKKKKPLSLSELKEERAEGRIKKVEVPNKKNQFNFKEEWRST